MCLIVKLWIDINTSQAICLIILKRGSKLTVNYSLLIIYILFLILIEIDNLGNVSVQDDQSEFDEHRFDRYRGNRYDAKMNFRDKYSLSDKKYKKEEYKRDWSSMFKRK